MAALQQSAIFAQGLARLGVRVEPGPYVVLVRAGLRLASRAGVPPDGVPLPRILNAERTEDASALRRVGYRQILTPAHVAEIDLSGTIPELRAVMAPPWRRALARAQAPGLVHRAFDPDREGWILAAEAAQRRARRYRAWPLALTQAMATAEPEAVRIWASGRDAAVVMVRHGDAASYHIGWTGPEGRTRDSHRALLWRAMQDLRGMGVRTLDLGHLDSEASPGLAAYKTGAGARVRPLGGTWLKCPGLGRGRGRSDAIGI